jgi:putative phosphoribosyl transferase
VIVATPVASADACAAIEPEVDTLVCLHRPEPFYAVGAWYADFEQLEDADVSRIMAEADQRLRRNLAESLP